MGYDLVRFRETVDEELICTICRGVFKDPVQIKPCEHAFCRACIEQWISKSPTCPLDRAIINASNLSSAPRVLKAILSSLSIACDYAENGCAQVLRLDGLSSHLQVCWYNPENTVRSQDENIRNNLRKWKLQLDSAKKDFNVFSMGMDKLRRSKNPAARRACSEQMDEFFNKGKKLQLELDELKYHVSVATNGIGESDRSENVTAEYFRGPDFVRWVTTLRHRTLKCWGELIPTPDEDLKKATTCALLASGCPGRLLEPLMQNCDECNWPTGLKTKEIRQANRRIYENYICLRIPGAQAVVALSYQNASMSDELMVAPGIVFIFPGGFE